MFTCLASVPLGSFHCSLLCSSRAKRPSSTCGSKLAWLVLCFSRLSFYGFSPWHESCSENICHSFSWVVNSILMDVLVLFPTATDWALLISSSLSWDQVVKCPINPFDCLVQCRGTRVVDDDSGLDSLQVVVWNSGTSCCPFMAFILCMTCYPYMVFNLHMRFLHCGSFMLL